MLALIAALALPQALDVAKASKTLVFADFEAPWCYSCYYMEQKVLSKDSFKQAAEGLVFAKIDVDTPEGRKLKEKYAVTFLPSYLLLEPSGKEVGRLVGEQTEPEFVRKLAALRAKPEDNVAEAIKELRHLLAAKRWSDASRMISRLPGERAKALEFQPEWKILTRRLELMRAIEAKSSVHQALYSLLSVDQSCDTIYDIMYSLDLVDSLPPESRTATLRLAESKLQQLIAVEGTCADERTAATTLADVYAKLDRQPERKNLLAKMVERFEKRAKTGEDRNRDDNLRVFLELAGEDGRLRKFFEELIKAYPQDYVYAFRYARYLNEKGEHEAALPWAEAADKLSYGANRLSVTKVRAQALAKLGKLDEAKALLKRDIKAGRSVFPKEAKALEELLATLK